jgi:hypothetical protein
VVADLRSNLVEATQSSAMSVRNKYSDISAALDAINTGFDQCRQLCSCG